MTVKWIFKNVSFGWCNVDQIGKKFYQDLTTKSAWNNEKGFTWYIHLYILFIPTRFPHTPRYSKLHAGTLARRGMLQERPYYGHATLKTECASNCQLKISLRNEEGRRIGRWKMSQDAQQTSSKKKIPKLNLA